MSKFSGPGEKMTRAPRTKNSPRENDEQTEIEMEMASSGRTDIVPHQGLVGAHTARMEPATQMGEEEGGEPTGPGSDVAPTKLAEARERERHRLERERGRTPAAENGSIHEQRSASVTREDMEEAQREADRRVIGHEIPKRSS